VNVLAFDCAGFGCSAAVLMDGRVAAREQKAMERRHAEVLLPMIETVLARAGTSAAALDLIAVTNGPGSFTGVRIGLAAARGLALATGRPAAGISSFDAVAAAVPDDGSGRPLVVALESRRGDFFLQCFAPSGAALDAPRAVPPEHADAALPQQPLRVAGDAAARLLPLLQGRAEMVDGTGLVNPAVLARLAAERASKGAPLPLLPLYLRAPDTTLPRGARVPP
jgi:tRNA threonylcarbamoyladenosine biosynthesis protein TsaB